jgi:hypothetical protein
MGSSAYGERNRRFNSSSPPPVSTTAEIPRISEIQHMRRSDGTFKKHNQREYRIIFKV